MFRKIRFTQGLRGRFWVAVGGRDERGSFLEFRRTAALCKKGKRRNGDLHTFVAHVQVGAADVQPLNNSFITFVSGRR